MIEKLVSKGGGKILLVVLDGVGGVLVDGVTELEKAYTPNLDKLTKTGITGATIPISRGITPGSGPAHLALFGYNPVEYEIGRGILEALGVGVEVLKGDVVARGNFATLNEKRKIIDRRAGRISTETNKKLCEHLNERIKKIEKIEVKLFPGKEHRFVLLLRGKGLSPQIQDTDPQKINTPPLPAVPLTPEGEETARIVNLFIQLAEKLLPYPTNGILLRGFASLPTLKSMEERFKLKALGVASYPMYKGIAKLVGMEVVNLKEGSIEEEIRVVEERWERYDFFYLHIKKIDTFGEDGNFIQKVKMIEEVDKFIPRLIKLNPDVLVITGDHSTPALLKSHSWHPNPFLLISKYVIPDEVERFTEKQCRKGGLGIFPLIDVMPLMLAYALRLKKFGA
jgi:2,3-bisphosphoglycerate-independent phosphoglycerate mutase